MNHETSYGGRAHENPGGSILLSDSMVTLIKGIVVHSHHMGLHRPTVRIRAGRRVDLRIRLPIGDERCFFPGQQVIVTIPAEAVRLEAGLFRRSRQRLNRWDYQSFLTYRLTRTLPNFARTRAYLSRHRLRRPPQHQQSGIEL